MVEILHDTLYYNFKRHNEVNTELPAVLVLPPFAGRDGTVADPLIAKCVGVGRGCTVYSYNLKSATQQTKNLSIDGLFLILRGILDAIKLAHPGKKIRIAGTCQGGWVAAALTALYPDEVEKLALFAAPTNLNTGCNNAIEKYCSTIDMDMHKLAVAANGGIQSGLSQWWAFAMLAPWQIFLGRYLDLYWHIVNGNDKEVKKWWKVNTWYDNYQHIAGPLFLETLENHFVNNRLYDGTWVILGRRVDLADITCDVHVYAGEDDNITSTEQARGILDKVSSANKYFTVFPEAGHTRVFTGGKELEIFANEFFNNQGVQNEKDRRKIDRNHIDSPVDMPGVFVGLCRGSQIRLDL